MIEDETFNFKGFSTCFWHLQQTHNIDDGHI